MISNSARSKIDLKDRAYKYAVNIMEAQAGSTKKDFTNFFHHALKSANESKFWLSLLSDTQRIAKDKIQPLLQETIELANILAASILTLKGKRY